MAYALLHLLAVLLVVGGAMAQIPSNTPVVSMLGMIPQCSVPCVMTTLFEDGGCPMTTATALGDCACTNATIKSHLSACVQRSCGFAEQIQVTVFTGGVCESYPKESRVNELKTVAIATIALSVPFLSLRLYSRLLNTRRLWSDDAYAMIAAILLVAVSVIILRMSSMGFGLHYWDIPVAHGVELLKLYYACQMLYVLVQIFSKVAILALYSRLFPDFMAWFRWSVRIMIAFMFIHGFVYFLLVTFQCLPIASIWNKTIDGKCLPVNIVIGFTGAGLSIVEDVIILLLPIHPLWQLQMSFRKKVGLILLISVGSFACITSIVRLKFVLKYANTYDSTWDNVDVIKWSLIEILSACICGNLIPLRPLFDKVLPSLRSLFNSSSKESRKTSEKSSDGVANPNWHRANNPVRKPNITSTLRLTRMSLNPQWVRDEEEAVETISPLDKPLPPVPEMAHKAHEHYVEERCFRSISNRCTRGSFTSTTRTSDDESEASWGNRKGLKLPARDREQCHSGSWSRALSMIFERR
ncbi:integral membrane protein [Stemphylium lycopersici]|nr:integral membrane protein [Stemphylium lycopersici]